MTVMMMMMMAVHLCDYTANAQITMLQLILCDIVSVFIVNANKLPCLAGHLIISALFLHHASWCVGDRAVSTVASQQDVSGKLPGAFLNKVPARTCW